MGVYVITNGEGSYIRRDEASGKYVPIRSFSKATQWDSVVKANGILNNSISKNIRSGYAVQLVDTEKTVVKENTSVQNDLCFRNITDDNISEWLQKINTIMDVMSGSDARQQELNSKLSEVDKEIVDVEHYIEFGKFNAYQGFMCFKMLQNLLKTKHFLCKYCGCEFEVDKVEYSSGNQYNETYYYHPCPTCGKNVYSD